MGEDGRIVYRVVVDDDGAIREAEAAGQQIGATMDRAAKGGSGGFQQIMTGAARQIGAAFVQTTTQAVKGVEQITQAGVEFNAKMETYQTAFTTLLGSAEDAATVMDQIRQDAASTPFDVDSLTQANQMLISAGISAEDSRDQILNLANAIAATGGGSAELSRMAANLQQIQNVGKATAMDIRQFANAGINIYGLLADSMGITTEQAAEMDVTYEQLAAAFEKAAAEGGVYAGALEAQSQTFNGQISTLKDNLQQLGGVLTQDLFSKLSENTLPKVVEWVNTLLSAAQENGIEGVLKVVGNIFHKMVDSFIEHLPEIIDTSIKVAGAILDGLSEVIKELPRVVVAIVTTLAGKFIEHLPEILATGVKLIGALLEGIAKALPDLIGSIPEMGAKIIEAFADVPWASIGLSIVDGIWKGILKLWDSLVDRVKSMAQSLINGVKHILGISSPSKEFQYIGKMCVEGAELGFEDNESQLLRTVKTTFDGVPNAAAIATAGIGSDVGASIATNISHNVTSNVSGGNTYYITIDPHNVEDFNRIVDLFNGAQVMARMKG